MSQTACSEWTVSAGQADWGSAESEGTLARVQCSNGDDGKRSHDDEEKAGSVDANALIIPLVFPNGMAGWRSELAVSQNFQTISMIPILDAVIVVKVPISP
uniref:Uncharacterized protein n=1 Tax=Bionectria ochroleuca TaxID=29856 RepID=A0A0B7JT05_BIOOC